MFFRYFNSRINGVYRRFLDVKNQKHVAVENAEAIDVLRLFVAAQTYRISKRKSAVLVFFIAPPRVKSRRVSLSLVEIRERGFFSPIAVC